MYRILSRSLTHTHTRTHTHTHAHTHTHTHTHAHTRTHARTHTHTHAHTRTHTCTHTHAHTHTHTHAHTHTHTRAHTRAVQSDVCSCISSPYALSWPIIIIQFSKNSSSIQFKCAFVGWKKASHHVQVTHGWDEGWWDCSAGAVWLQGSRAFGVDLLTGLFLFLKSRAERLHFIWDQTKHNWQRIWFDMKKTSSSETQEWCVCHAVAWDSITDKTFYIRLNSSLFLLNKNILCK